MRFLCNFWQFFGEFFERKSGENWPKKLSKIDKLEKKRIFAVKT